MNWLAFFFDGLARDSSLRDGRTGFFSDFQPCDVSDYTVPHPLRSRLDQQVECLLVRFKISVELVRITRDQISGHFLDGRYPNFPQSDTL